MDEIVKLILGQINGFLEATGLNVPDTRHKKPGDKLLLINNSFPFRDESIKTKKSSMYLALPAELTSVGENDVFVIEGKTTTIDYTYISKEDQGIKAKYQLRDAVAQQLETLGNLVFILISEIDDSLSFEEPVAHQIISKIILDPRLSNPMIVTDQTMTVQDLNNLASIWSGLERVLGGIPETEADSLKQALTESLRKLRQQAYARLIIPGNIDDATNYFLDKILIPLRKHLDLYVDVLQQLDTGNPDSPIPTEVLRIAYNFTDDALKVIRVLVSVCDLKPLVLWGTFLAHYHLSEALKSLPWVKQKTKPKLSLYRDQIAKARNSAFHRLLSFSKSFEVVVPDSSLKDVRIRIFSEYAGRTNPNTFTFQDKELVDVLMEFSRTSEEVVDRTFWRRNTEVMERTAQMVETTSQFLKSCRSVS
jgi:hypothetical protein